MRRLSDLDRFYGILLEIERRSGGRRRLADCHGKLVWPSHGVYFFFESGERREGLNLSRVVRVGTHALTGTSKTTLWQRLAQHRGATSGSGNHRGSIFRLLVGEALQSRSSEQAVASWGKGTSAQADIRYKEKTWEANVTDYLGRMEVIVLEVSGAEASQERAYIERNSIALLSNFGKSAIDGASESWLGHQSGREKVRLSGLWNSRHVDEKYDTQFLDKLSDRAFRQFAINHPTAKFVKWRRDGSLCPFCKGPGRFSPSYPGAVCWACETRLRHSDGQPVDLFNVNPFASGIAVETSSGSVEYRDIAIFADDIPCWAREVRWGGIAVQPIEVWETAHPRVAEDE